MKSTMKAALLMILALVAVFSAAPLMASEHAAGESAESALAKLRAGNERFVRSSVNPGDYSHARRAELKEGQAPYAVIVSCSDSRVVPEAIFCAGLGELFVIRVAGNVLGEHELGSVEYATGHLGTNLVVVLGHESCGAVGATLSGHAEGYIYSLTDAIAAGIGTEKDPKAASIKNADYVAREIARRLELPSNGKVKVMSAFYNLDGRVDFGN